MMAHKCGVYMHGCKVYEEAKQVWNNDGMVTDYSICDMVFVCDMKSMQLKCVAYALMLV